MKTRKSQWTATGVSLVAVASLSMLAACTGTKPAVPPARYRGSLDVYLEPNDAQGVCSVTIGLHNVSGVRQREAWLRLLWFDAAGTQLADQSLRMDPLDIDRYDAKNLVLAMTCDRVQRMQVKSAEWTLFRGWDTPVNKSVVIDDVDHTEWRMRWDAGIGLFVGVSASG